MTEAAVFGNQTALAFAVVWLIELLKRSWMPWFGAHSDQLNRFTSVLIAAVSAIGLTWCLHGSLATGGSITITFPSGAEMLQAAIHFLYQIGVQQGFYNVAVKPKTTVVIPVSPSIPSSALVPLTIGAANSSQLKAP